MKRAIGLSVGACIAVGIFASLYWLSEERKDPPSSGPSPVPAVAFLPPYDQKESADAWESLLQRPIKLPILQPGDCPSSDTTIVNDRRVAGEYPLHAIVEPSAVIVTTDPDTGGWRSQKVLWFSSNGYVGPAVIRGRQLAGPSELEFESGANGNGPRMQQLLLPYGSTGISTGANDWGQGVRWLPSALFFSLPGCYALQVDGPTFEYVIVIRVLFRD